MDNGFKYIIKNKGIDSETDYNYTAKTDPCDVGHPSSSLVPPQSYPSTP